MRRYDEGNAGGSTMTSEGILQIPKSAEHKHKDKIPELSAQEECSLSVDIMMHRTTHPRPTLLLGTSTHN